MSVASRTQLTPPALRVRFTERISPLNPARYTIGVLVDRLEDEYQNQVFAGLEAAARRRDVNLICLCGGILEAPHSSGRERNFLFDLIQPASLDGLVIMSGAIANHVGSVRLAEYCARFNPLPLCSVGVELTGMPNVLIDNASGLEQSISGLIEDGQRRRIAFIRGPVQNQEAELRYQAYERTLDRCGLPFDINLVTIGDFQKASGTVAIQTLLDERRQDFDAIVAASDYMALGALEELIRRSIAVPGDVSVSGFDDVEDARFAAVPLSTVRQPLHEQGQRAVEVVLDQIQNRAAVGDVVLATAVVIRSSCGRARSSQQGSANAGDAEYDQARKRLEQGRQLQALRRFGQTVSSALTEHEVLSATRQELPTVGISSGSICLYDSVGTAPLRLRRIRMDACPPETRLLNSDIEALIGVSGILARSQTDKGGRYTAVAQPLFSNDGPLGITLFDVGPAQGTVYEFLREQISASLRTATLVKRLINETTRRQVAEEQQMARELQIAASIQTSILPQLLQAPGLELAAVMIPAAQVGGDYYDVLPFADGCWLGIGDVAGHGLSTGLVMLMIQSVISGISTFASRAPPNEIVAVLNEVIYKNVRERLHRDEHATLTLIRYTIDGALVLAGGHDDIILCRGRDGSCELIPSPGPWIGAFRDVKDSNFNSHHQLERGDLLVLYTDGITEATDASGRQFGLERLCKELYKVRAQSVGAIRDHLLQRVQGWCINQEDDMTLLVARYVG